MPPKIKFKTTDRRAAVAGLAGKYHHHKCRTCGLRFSDACQEPTKDTVCFSCQNGHQRSLWYRDLDPRECCIDAKLMEDPREVARYSLGGPGPWYKCPTCSRQHPYLPKKKDMT